MSSLREILGIEYPIIQAPMAGVQGSALAIAVSSAGGLGSLPCAMLSVAALRSELAAIRTGTDRPYNVNFFCHTPPKADAARENAWRGLLSKYYEEFGISAGGTSSGGPGRAPFSEAAADVLAEFKPPVVSFHFGLPPDHLLGRVRAMGSKIFASATTIDEARWLEERGVDAIIAQGLEAGGHRGMFLSDDLTGQAGTFALLPQLVRSKNSGDCGGRNCRCAGSGRRDGAGGFCGADRDRLAFVSRSDNGTSPSRCPAKRCRGTHGGYQSFHRTAGSRHC
jgi:nitronate monooxygenase